MIRRDEPTQALQLRQAGAGLRVLGEVVTSDLPAIKLTIAGSLAEVNAARASLSYDSATAGKDTVSVADTDSNGAAATKATIAVTVAATPTVQFHTLTSRSTARDAAARCSLAGEPRSRGARRLGLGQPQGA